MIINFNLKNTSKTSFQEVFFRLYVLKRITYFTFEKSGLLGNAFIDSQFNYPPLILINRNIDLRNIATLLHEIVLQEPTKGMESELGI